MVEAMIKILVSFILLLGFKMLGTLSLIYGMRMESSGGSLADQTSGFEVL
jgi:hypothetical protein